MAAAAGLERRVPRLPPRAARQAPARQRVEPLSQSPATAPTSIRAQATVPTRERVIIILFFFSVFNVILFIIVIVIIVIIT